MNYLKLIVNYLIQSSPFNSQPQKMVKHIQTIHRLLPTNWLSVFEQFEGLALRGLMNVYFFCHGNLFFFCQRVQCWDQEYNTANAVFFSTNQIADILLLLFRYYVSDNINNNLSHETSQPGTNQSVFQENQIYSFKIHLLSF